LTEAWSIPSRDTPQEVLYATNFDHYHSSPPYKTYELDQFHYWLHLPGNIAANFSAGWVKFTAYGSHSDPDPHTIRVLNRETSNTEIDPLIFDLCRIKTV